MSSILPPDFVGLKTASSRLNSELNVIGIVTDFMPSKPSRGTDWMCSFTITDPSFNGLNASCDEGLKIKFFRPTQNELPQIRGAGDVVLIRFLKITQFSGMTTGLSNRGTSWVVFPATTIPAEVSASQIQPKHIKEPRASAPSLPEMRYAVAIYHSRDPALLVDESSTPVRTSGALLPTPSATISGTLREKFALVKDISCDTYHDLVGQVIRTYSHSDRVELYFTDYTSNNLLFNYEWGQDDEDLSGREGDVYDYVPRASVNKKWPGPFGKMTLTVTLWPPHASFCRLNIKENDYVYLRNVHIKFSKDSKLEGVLHTDQRSPDRINVTIMKNDDDDDRFKDVLRRKRDYSKKFTKSSESFIAEARALKRKSMNEAKPLSKTAQRKKRKQERETLAKAQYRPAEQEPERGHGVKIGVKVQQADDGVSSRNQRQDLNPNVKCSNHLITPRSLTSIKSTDRNGNTTPEGTSYTLPFHNIKSRATVRVIDFFPSDLAEFSVPRPKPSEFDILSDASDSEDGIDHEASVSDASKDAESERRWEWRFSLKLEDATGPSNEQEENMEVYVAGQDAECLLKLDAENLRKSPKALAALREKLFLLWGDLEERKVRKASSLKEVGGNARLPLKQEKPKSKPFQCCIKEYGVRRSAQRGIGIIKGIGDDEYAGAEGNWEWERKWKMFGTTII